MNAAITLALAVSQTPADSPVPLPKLHVEGRHLVTPEGRRTNIYGYMQPGAAWFNAEAKAFSDPKDTVQSAQVRGALSFYKEAATVFTTRGPLYGRTHGWSLTYVRFIGDGGGVSNFAHGWNDKGVLDRPDQFKGWINGILVPFIQHCARRGLYVVLVGNPSEALPPGKDGRPDGTKNMSRQYQANLIKFWTMAASHRSIKSAANVQFELCNEPIAIESAFGKGDWGSGSDDKWRALTLFMQPVVDSIRRTGADNIIWVPGLGWQGEAQGWAKFPIKGKNIGYAAHLYPAYGGVKDDPAAVGRLWDSNYKPAADIAPMIITELFWDPNKGAGYEGLWNAHTEGFGRAVRQRMDEQGNVSFNVGMIGDLLSGLEKGPRNATLNPKDAAQAFYEWSHEYAHAR